VVCISQSGETADTLAALKIAKEKGAFIYGICNVVGSSISRATHSGMYTHAGPEIGVASTKAFSSQITVLILLALKLAELKNTIDPETSKAYQKELSEIPSLIEAVIKNNSTIKTIAEKYADSTNCIYMGRGYNFPVALEGALKLKEISYIHAEGYPAAEMKHGPIALIDKNMPVVVIATKKTNYDKIVSNIQEIKSREGKIIAIVSEGDKTIAKLANDVIEIPDVSEFFTPIIAAIPLQLLSYYIAIIRGCNVDQPRNLAKSVTVE
jgi:glucosamine--fructose-6-phosphate aminotransferase (isomerizing)